MICLEIVDFLKWGKGVRALEATHKHLRRMIAQASHPEEILWVVFPANDDTAKVMKPSEQTLDFPAAAIAAQHAAILSGLPRPSVVVGSGQLHGEALANLSTITHAFLSSFRVLFTRARVIHYCTTGAILFAPLPRLLGKKIVCSVDGTDWQRKKWGNLAHEGLAIS